MLQEIRYAFRSLRKSPGFTIIAVLTLALGIGANTAIFTVIDAVLLRPFPYKEPSRLMILGEKYPDFDQGSISYLNYKDWLSQQHTFTGIAAWRSGGGQNLITPSGPEFLSARQVTSNFLSVLGVSPILGRDFTPDDDHIGAAPVVLMSYRLWQSKYGGDPAFVGTNITLNNTSATVVGILPPNFSFYEPTDLYVPIATENTLWISMRENRSGLLAVGRLNNGVSVPQAQADLDTVAANLRAAFPEINAKMGISMRPIFADVVGETGKTLTLLFAAVGFVLLIACVNVANLLLARGNARQREIAVRTALGAGRWRIARQLLTESVTLGLMGGLGGLLIAAVGTDALVAAVPGSLPRIDHLGIDWRVMAFALVASIGTGILFGVAPALQALRTDVQDSLKSGGRGSTSGRHGVQHALVVCEVALALILLVGSGLMLRSVIGLTSVYPGFQAQGITVFSVTLPAKGYETGLQVRHAFDQLVASLKAQPGVEAVALNSNLPLRDDSESVLYVVGRPKPRIQDMTPFVQYFVSADYLKVMQLHLLAGRFLTDRDQLDSPFAVVIDEVFAKEVFPNGDAIGKYIVQPFPGIDAPRQIVGIVGHVRHSGLSVDDHAKIRSQMYMPLTQIPNEVFTEARQAMTFLMRSRLDSRGARSAILAAVQQVDATLPVWQMTTMDQVVTTSIAVQRFAAMLLGVFAALAFVLAAIGIYGVMAFAVTQRTHEIGIRLAIGANARDILALILGRAMTLVGIGMAAGLMGAFALTRYLSSYLYGISANDPVTYVAVASILASVAFLASYIPARRAMRVDPMVALHYE
jgi:putative ABC transport system permease protein